MAQTPESELCFQVPVERVEGLISEINTRGLEVIVNHCLEDLVEQEPVLACVVAGMVAAATVETASDLETQYVKDCIKIGAAISYFAYLHCVHPDSGIRIDTETARMLFQRVDYLTSDDKEAGTIFYIEQYQKDNSLCAILSHLNLAGKNARAQAAQLGAGLTSYFLNEWEAFRRQASNN